jgi:23S rRNA (adenine2030-N6)-methyltransferase
MLSYRHSFHAGNPADVLKHTVLIQILKSLTQKDKPICCIDTHAGTGLYALDSSFALKNKEFADGIEKLWRRKDLPASVADYVKLVKGFNSDPTKLTRYPGSPLITAQFLRNKDRLFLYELHPTEIKALTELTAKKRQIKAVHADGLAGAIGLLPPIERRGLVLIDPSYEIKSDYELVVESLIKMHKRFATGTYALWYPVIERAKIQRMEKAIQNTGIKNIQLFELDIQADSDEIGMTGSGMIVINPPWTLMADMRTTLPWLAKELGLNGAGSHRCQVLAAE